MPNLELKASGNARHAVLILWPAFLAACLLEALVFSLVDPGDVHWFGQASQPSRQGVYSVAFFCFWLISAACSGFVLWLNSEKDREKINCNPAN
jgi:hypothetical protein